VRLHQRFHHRGWGTWHKEKKAIEPSQNQERRGWGREVWVHQSLIAGGERETTEGKMRSSGENERRGSGLQRKGKEENVKGKLKGNKDKRGIGKEFREENQIIKTSLTRTNLRKNRSIARGACVHLGSLRQL